MAGEEILLIGGGAAVIAVAEAPAPTPRPVRGAAGGVPISGTVPGTSVTPAQRLRNNIIGRYRTQTSAGNYSPLFIQPKSITPSGYYSTGPGAASPDGNLGGKLDLINQFAEAAYALLPDDAKQKACDALNSELGTSLTPSTAWTDLINAITAVTK